jgi:hypothetical protein
MGRYQQWLDLTGGIEGFLSAESAAAWDVLLDVQEMHGISGALGEIGVAHGKSAALLALHVGATEHLYLADTAEYPETRFLQRVLPREQTTFLIGRSSGLPAMVGRIQHLGRFRWIHIDGEHTGEAVANDLRLATFALHDRGVICLDDFFSPRYPQLTAATFHFLAAHPHELTLFLCGHNKGYLCRPTAAPLYLETIRSSLVAGLSQRGVRDVTVFKTTPSSDMNCFGIMPRWKDFDLYGMDANPDVLPP